jgi:DNA-binding LacI/PurR family transcriptional regulator
MKVTLKDIARISKVSKATVSYVINGKQSSIGISQSTIDKVMRICRELDYTPDKNAAALSKKRKFSIKAAIFSPWLHRPDSTFTNDVNKAVENMQNEISMDYKMFSGGKLSSALKKNPPDKYEAIIIMGTNKKDDNYLKKNIEKLKNVILLNREIKGLFSVSLDDIKGGNILAKHGIDLNYYDKYVIMHPRLITQTVDKRIRGILDIFRKNKYKKPDLLALDELSEVPLENWFDNIIKKYTNHKTLFFTMQDYIAARFLSHLIKRKIKVPEMFGVTGYDATKWAKIITPSITTVDTKIYEMSITALKMCIKVSKSQKVKPIRLKPKLVVGNSTNTVTLSPK